MCSMSVQLHARWAPGYSKYPEKKVNLNFIRKDWDSTRMHVVCQISTRSSPPIVFLSSCRHRKTVWSLSVSTAAARYASSAVARGWRYLALKNQAVRWGTWGSKTPQRLACCRQLSVTAVVRVDKDPSVVTGTNEAAAQLTAAVTAPSVGEQSQSLLDSMETSTRATWAADATSIASELPAQGDFTSLGLGGYSPIGLIQWSLEYLHVHAHLPWWLAIVASTLVLRTLLLPVAINVQANAARLNNIRPETERLMAKVRQYKQAGNLNIAEQQMAKVYALYAKHNCHPFKMMLMPVMQVPIFISFFVALRRMAAVPVESMKTGGILWFTDLTVPDPYYVLPLLGCASFMAIIEVGPALDVVSFPDWWCRFGNENLESVLCNLHGLCIAMLL